MFTRFQPSLYPRFALALALSVPVTAAALCPPVSAQARGADRFPSLRLSDMANADAPREVARRVARGDLRFVGVNGFSLMVPGIAGGAVNRLVQAKGVNDIQGTSDAIGGPEQLRLQSLALRYARRCNALLLDYLRQSHDPDLRRAQQQIEAELTRMEQDTPADDARKAIQKKDSRLLAIALDNGKSDVPGLTGEQSGEQPLRVLAFSPDLATEEQTRRMRKLVVSYAAPYNRIIYRAVPRRHIP